MKDAGRVPAVVIMVLGALTGVGPFSLDAYLPGFPAVAREFDVAPSLVQLSFTACLIGLAIGQLIIGPWADRVGRRLPVLLGCVGYVLTSLACAAAPSIELFVVARFAQGFCGAAGIVVARAVVRDLASGRAAVRIYSQLAFVTGLAPVIAPLLGSLALMAVSWRSVFVGLAGLGVLLGAAVWFLLPETHTAELRVRGSLASLLSAFGALLRFKAFAGYVLVGGFAAAVLFGYISSSSFVIQDVYGGSSTQFALIFAVNGFGLALANQLNGRIAARVGAARMLRIGVVIQVLATAALTGLVLMPLSPGIVVVALLLFLTVAPLGLVMPNAMAIAMSASGRHAGTASALLGVTTFLFGAVVTPLSGLGQPAIAMAVIMLGASLAAMVVVLLMRRAETHDQD